jgi:hypothetical protein
MSAFFVGTTHVNALLSYLQANSRHTEAELTEMGKTLLRENVRSLETRYPSHTWEAARHDAEEFKFKCIGHRKLSKLTAMDIISMCGCFDYQACETDDYEFTEASTIIDKIRRAAFYDLPRGDNLVYHYAG